MEMATGTFYLLVVSIAMAAVIGGYFLAASLVWQLVICALTVIAGVIVLRRWKGTRVQ